MRRIHVALAAAALALALASPAWAKGVAEARINGPGLGVGGMRISGPDDTEGLWQSGVMDFKSSSLERYGLEESALGPRFTATYRFDFGPGSEDDPIRQDLYPYAPGGPVTFTPPGQVVDIEEGDRMPIEPGWYRAPSQFLRYLVDHGLPATADEALAASGAPAGREPQAAPTPWIWILGGGGLLAAGAVALATVRARRRATIA